jgi:gluconate 5-dehydrogenase
VSVAITSPPVIPEFNLTGKAGVVTGGSRSIGRGSAAVLADAGASVILSGRNLNDLERVREEIT